MLYGNSKKSFHLVLTDGRGSEVDLGKFEAVSFHEAQKIARKRYSGMFRRLTLREWNVKEAKG